MNPVKYIVDTTMRDGAQSPSVFMTKEQKLKIAKILDGAGVWQIEAGIPASGSEEIDTLCEIMEQKKRAQISVWNRLHPDDIKKSFLCKPDIIHISVPVSYAQIYSKLNKNKVWITKNLFSCVSMAKEQGYDVTVGFEDASRADITFMAKLCVQLKGYGVERIRFADTVGILSPARTEQTIRDLIEYSGIGIQIHAHNDLGMAVANSIAGAKAGADYIDTTILGIGERAGNCDFVKLLHASQELFDLKISYLDAFCAQEEISDLLQVCS